MNRQENTLSLQTLKIIWASLTMTLFLYGFVLFTLKGGHLALPQSYTLVEKVALIYNLLILVTFFIHEKVVKTQTDTQKRGSYYVICWALNESVAIMAFAAVFMNPEGNMLLYVINASMALVGNMLTFPRVQTGPA